MEPSLDIMRTMHSNKEGVFVLDSTELRIYSMRLHLPDGYRAFNQEFKIKDIKYTRWEEISNNKILVVHLSNGWWYRAEWITPASNGLERIWDEV